MAAAPGLLLGPLRPLRPLPLPLLLLLLLLGAPGSEGSAGRGRRFSELKVCADDECSMLMYRGEALEDFVGPDCRFVNFKKGDTVYVYYKLAGIVPEVWAGSVGQAFGYFPKDLIHIAYTYTKKELQVPADETDFVCFSGGKDDFSNYDVENLLAYMELPEPDIGDAEAITNEASLHEENASEVAEVAEPLSEPGASTPEDSGPVTSGSAQERQNRPEPPAEPAQGAPPPPKSLEAKLQDRLQTPAGENRAGNSSHSPSELDKIDAYKLLKQDMTLDLKTKFGSTADALVSDDETTRLVTALEDDFDEDLEAEYYEMEGIEEEESQDVPLLTFMAGEAGPSPGAPEVQGDPAGLEQNFSGEAGEQGLQTSGVRAVGDPDNDGAADPGAVGLGVELSDTDDTGVATVTVVTTTAESKSPEPPLSSALKLTGSVRAPGALGTGGNPQASKVKESKVDIEAPISSVPIEAATEESGATLPGAGQVQDTIPTVAASEDPLGAIHISKEPLGEPSLVEGSGREQEAKDRPTHIREDKGLKWEPKAAGTGENWQLDTSQTRMQENGGLGGDPKPPHTLPIGLQRATSEENPQLSGGLQEGAPSQATNTSGQHQGATEKEQTDEGKVTISEKKDAEEKEVEEDFLKEGASLGSPDVYHPGQATGPHPGEAEAEADVYIPEEQLEDENALSAQQAGAMGAQMNQDTPLSLELQDLKGAASGALGNVPESMEHSEETQSLSKTGDTGGDAADGDPLDQMAAKETSNFMDHRAQAPSMVPDVFAVNTPETPEAAVAPQEDNPEPGPPQQLREGDRQEQDAGISRELMDNEHEASLALGPPQHLRIMSNFFKDVQSWQRFQKYLDVSELEALLQALGLELKTAQQESLPYNVDKVLDKVFRAAESHILSVAEHMLDTRVSNRGNLGASNDLEESAVLEDVQDLLYFVRYQHFTIEQPPLLPTATAPPDQTLEAPVEDLPPPLEEDFLQEKVEDLLDLEPSPGEGAPVEPPGMSVIDGPEEPLPEESAEAGIQAPESAPIEALDTDRQLDIHAEKSSSFTLLGGAAHLIYSFLAFFTGMLVATLPEDAQPGPDFNGLPWQPVLATAFLGIVSFIVFWRTVLEVKSKKYQVTEEQISEKVKNLKKENAELAQELSNYEQKIKESKKLAQETKKHNVILSDKTVKYEDKIKKLEERNETLNSTIQSLQEKLESERIQNVKNQDLILENKKSLKKLKDVISMNASELSEVQIALNETKLREEKVKSECHRVQEENAKLKKKEEQLQQEIKEWSKSHSELSEQIKSFAQSQKDLEATFSHQDDNIHALTNCITQLNRLDCKSPTSEKGRNESEDLANGEVGGDPLEKVKTQIKQMMDVSRTQTAVSVVEEDLKLLQLKLRAAMSTKSDLEGQIKELEGDRSSLLSTKSGLEDECKMLRQKVEVLNELYQQKEMMLQKKLSQEEFERQEREQRLSAADEKAFSAAEEVKMYKQRIEEMEEELTKTERSFKNQIATHEKKAHDNWLKARAAERAIAEEKREAANLRLKLLELSQKMAMLQEEPVIVKPMPGRPGSQNPPRRGPLSQNGSFGPSPVSTGDCSPPPPTTDPPTRPLLATALGRREVPHSEFDAAGPGPNAAPMMNSSSRGSSPSRSLEDAKPNVPLESAAPTGPSIPPLTEHPEAVNMAMKGPPPFPGMPILGGPMAGPPPPPMRYGPPPQLGRPFGPRPMPPIPPPFGPPLRPPPLGLRDYPPGVPPGMRDPPYDPREFMPGHAPFRPLGPLGPREYFIPGPRLLPPPHGPLDYPPPPHGPQDYPPPPHGSQDHPPLPPGPQDPPASSAARDLPPPGSREEPPCVAQGGSPTSAQARRRSP